MSVNFGYGGYSAMNSGMNVGSANMAMNSQNTFYQMKAKYGCEHCYQTGATPYTYQLNVNPLPDKVNNPSFLRRLFAKIVG